MVWLELPPKRGKKPSPRCVYLLGKTEWPQNEVIVVVVVVVVCCCFLIRIIVGPP